MGLRKTYRLLFAAVVSVLIIASPMPHAAAEELQQQPASAQSALAVSPAIMEEVLTPGEQIPFTLNVHNVTNFPLPIKAFVRNLTVQSEEFEKTDQARLDASRWFSINEPDFILQPNQVRTVEGTISPPVDAAPGGHYATIYFQPLVPAEALSPSMAYVNSRVGVLAFLVVKGEIEQKVAFDKSLQTAGLIRSGPIEFEFSLRNSGNVHIVPTGKLTVYDWRGRQVAQSDVPNGIILPDATKHYTMQWDPPGFAGKYRAELSITYGTDQTALETSVVNVWMLPWIEAAVGILLLGALFFLVRRTRRRWRKAVRAYRGHSHVGRGRRY